VLDLEALAPQPERLEIRRRASAAFKAPREELPRIWRRYSEPLRSTLVELPGGYLVVEYREEGVVHVSDIVRYAIYGELPGPRVLGEGELRVMVRGLLYHSLYRRLVLSRATAYTEYVAALPVAGAVVVGSVDAVVFDGGRAYIVEAKSSDSPRTLDYGVLQAKVYWRVLADLGFEVAGAYVQTPTRTVDVGAPLRRRELRSLVLSLLPQLVAREANTNTGLAPY